MRARDLLGIVKIGDKGAAPWGTVALSGRSVVVHGEGFSLRYTAPGELCSGDVSVPSTWLRDVLGAVKRGGPLTLEATGGARAAGPIGPTGKRPHGTEPATCRATADGKRWQIQGERDDAALPFPGLARSEARALTRDELAPVDLAKDGPVARALASAGRDRDRASTYAVHLDTHASGTDGHALARLPLARPLASPAFVPVPLARALTALVATTAPARVVLRRDANGRAWFVGRTADGATWRLQGRLAAGPAPRYEAVERCAYSVAHVEAAEFRAVARGARRLAVMPCGGLVAWTEALDLACSLASYDGASDPIAVFTSDALPGIVKALPKDGRIAVSVDASGCVATVDGRVVMGVAPAFPDGVQEELARTFGLASAVPSERPASAEHVLTDAFARAVKEGSEPRVFSGESKVDPATARLRAEENVKNLGERCRSAVERGQWGNVPGLGSALLALARPTNRPGGTFLEFDPAPFIARALPAEEPRGRMLPLVNKRTVRARAANEARL